MEAWDKDMPKLGGPEKWALFPYSGPGKDYAAFSAMGHCLLHHRTSQMPSED